MLDTQVSHGGFRGPGSLDSAPTMDPPRGQASQPISTGSQPISTGSTAGPAGEPAVPIPRLVGNWKLHMAGERPGDEPKPLDVVPDSEPEPTELRPYREYATGKAAAASTVKALGRTLEGEIRNAAENGQVPPVPKYPPISSGYTVAIPKVLDNLTLWNSILHKMRLALQSETGPTPFTRVLVTPKGFPKNAPLLDAVVYPEQALMVVKNPRLDIKETNLPVKDSLPMGEILWQAYESGTGHSNKGLQIRKLLFLQIAQSTSTHRATRNHYHRSNATPDTRIWITRSSKNLWGDPWAHFAGSDLVQPVMRMLLEHGVELGHPSVARFAIMRASRSFNHIAGTHLLLDTGPAVQVGIAGGSRGG